jgi:hypothetical protein
MFESNSDQCYSSGNPTFYNNLFRHGIAGVTIWIAPETGCNPTYAWNNVFYDGMAQSAFMTEAALSNPGGTVYYINNTTEGGPNSGPTQTCYAIDQNSSLTVYIQNAHCISNSGTNSGLYENSAGASIDLTTNISQTLSTANAQGYSWSQTYGFSPTASSNATVGAGTNYGSIAMGSLASLASDTSYACTYSLATHTVTCPERSTISRGGASCTPLVGAPGCWDAGAPMFQSGSTVSPPTNLQAVVQ